MIKACWAKCLAHFLLCPNFSLFLGQFGIKRAYFYHVSSLSSPLRRLFEVWYWLPCCCFPALMLFLSSAFEPKHPNHRCSFRVFLVTVEPIVCLNNRQKVTDKWSRGQLWTPETRWKVTVLFMADHCDKNRLGCSLQRAGRFWQLFYITAPPGGLLIFQHSKSLLKHPVIFYITCLELLSSIWTTPPIWKKHDWHGSTAPTSSNV